MNWGIINVIMTDNGVRGACSGPGGPKNKMEVNKMTEKKNPCESGNYDDVLECVVGEVDDDADYITLEFDDGVELECEIMGVFDCEGREYIALIPGDGSDDVYLYGYKEVGEDEFELVDIEDDKEFEKVAGAFEKITAEE